MNLVSVLPDRAASHPRGTFTSVKDLNAMIRAFIDGWNHRCHPLVWTKSADQMLKKVDPKKRKPQTQGNR